MTHNSKQEIWNALQKEIQTPAFQRKFNRFKQTHPQFRQFDTAKELVEFLGIASSTKLCVGTRNDSKKDEILHSVQNDREKNQSNLCNQWLHLLVSHYRNKPKRKGWLLSLLLVISWKQMEQTFYRFGSDRLNRVNPYDSFAPVYAGYIDAFLSVKQKTAKKFALHLKDRAEYLVKKEIKECSRFKGEPEQEIPAPESLPWQEQVNEMIDEWYSKGILSRRQGKLIIDHLVYEFTYQELSKRQRVSPETIKKRFRKALRTLKPYLRGKYFDEHGNFKGYKYR